MAAEESHVAAEESHVAATRRSENSAECASEGLEATTKRSEATDAAENIRSETTKKRERGASSNDKYRRTTVLASPAASGIRGTTGMGGPEKRRREKRQSNGTGTSGGRTIRQTRHQRDARTGPRAEPVVARASARSLLLGNSLEGQIPAEAEVPRCDNRGQRKTARRDQVHGGGSDPVARSRSRASAASARPQAG